MWEMKMYISADAQPVYWTDSERETVSDKEVLSRRDDRLWRAQLVLALHSFTYILLILSLLNRTEYHHPHWTLWSNVSQYKSY